VEGVLCVPKLAEVVAEPSPASSEQPSGGSSSSSSMKLGLGGVGKAAASEGRVVRVVVSEGKKHEVRLLVAAAGLELLTLHRTRVGGYTLPTDLRPGDYM